MQADRLLKRLQTFEFLRGLDPENLEALAKSRRSGRYSRQALEAIILTHPQAAIQIIENMADKVIKLAALASDLSLKTVEARFAQLLLEQAEGDLIERRRWTTQSELAARLGTVPDVLRRIIRRLTKAGLVQVDRQQIRILDRKGLAERAMLDEKSNM